MAGRPLRKALSCLLGALLSFPAGAVEVKVPGEGKPSGSGGQAGAAGAASAPGASPLTPALGLNMDLSGSIRGLAGAPALNLPPNKPVLAPAAGDPAAAPAPAAAAEAKAAGYAQIRAAINPPAGYQGHQEGKAVFWPANVHAFLHESPDTLNEKTYRGIAAAYASFKAAQAGAAAHAAKGTQNALQTLAEGKATAAQTYENASKPSAVNPALPAAPVLPAFSGSAGSPLLPPALKPSPAAPQDAPGLKPAGVEAAQFKPFGPGDEGLFQPPSPPLPKKLTGLVKGLWAGLWNRPAGVTRQGFLKPGAPLPEPTPVLPMPAQEPLLSKGGLLVRAPRAVRRDALDYRIHYLDLSAAEGAQTVADPGVRIRLYEDGLPDDTAVLRARFARFNRLIANNFAALELFARSSGKITVKTARALFGFVEDMARDYAALAPSGEYTKVTRALTRLWNEFEAGVKARGLSESDLLTPELNELVVPIEKESVHHFINRIHQGALENIGRQGTAPPNISLVQGGRVLRLIDISENPLTENGRIVAPSLKAVVSGLLRSKDAPKGKLIMQDQQFQGHFQLGAHSAEVYANFLPPDEGGMIRVRYQEWGTGYDNQTRLYYVARLLQKTGFHVEQENGFLTAVVDKDHAAQTVDEMTETFALVLQALHATVGVDFALPMLVEGALSREEIGRRIDGWVDIVLGEGTLPFYVHDEQGLMIAKWQQYKRNEPRRLRLRAALDRRLEVLGLPPIPSAEPMGQRTIDRFVNQAIEKALARGELRLTPEGRLVRSPSWNEVSGFAAALEKDELGAARMAEVVTSLDPSLLRYETVGSLGGLTLERAQRPLDSDTWLTVQALRDPKTGQLGFARAEFARLSPGSAPRPVAPAELFKLLAEQGQPVAPFEPSAVPPGREHFERLLRGAPEREPADRARFHGLAASPAHGRPVVARVTYDKAKAARGGYIYMAPYTSPDDLDAIKASKAVLTTSGGLLSHAAITTREMHIPAAILMGVSWQGGQASLESRRFGPPAAAGAFRGRRALGSTRVALPEGAVVRLEPGSGLLEVFPGGISGALLDAAAALDRYDADRDGEALAAWLRQRAAGSALDERQRETVAAEALSGLAARALERPEAAGALSLARAALIKTQRGALADVLSARVFPRLAAEALESLEETRELIARSQSMESVDRLRLKAQERSGRLSAVAIALARPKKEVAELLAAAAALDAQARERGAKLLAEDVAELEEHARRYPSATLEALPLVKAAIAKARRRSLVPEQVARWEEQVRRLEAARESALKAEKPLVMPLRNTIDADVPAVGGKGAKLGEIAAVVERAGGAVPNALNLTIHAYLSFLEEAGIREALNRVMTDRALSYEQRSSQGKRLVLEGPPAAPGRAARTARLDPRRGVGLAIMDGLRFEGLDTKMLAVRSSAVDEDGAEAAFAGAGDTHLYVSPAELLAHVQQVWSSLFNPRALLYRETKGLSTASMAQAVVVQEMVPAEVAGVCFTQDPVSGDGSRLVVNAAFGLGEGVVSNEVTPDQYVLSKDNGIEMLPPLIGDKMHAVIRSPDGKGTVKHKMPSEWRRRRSLTPEKLAKLNRVAVALEGHFGYPLDIEFAFVGDKLFILQARPVTTAAAPPAVGAKPKELLFVCTGNTCRSPIAEQLARARLARAGRDDIRVASRGLFVDEGEGMSEAALAVLAERGIDGRAHSARALSAEDVKGADVILAMTKGQVGEILARHPSAKGKVFSVADYAKKGVDIADPYSGDAAAYRAVADALEDAVEAVVAP